MPFTHTGLSGFIRHAVALAALVALPSHGQTTFPHKPIRMVTALPAGNDAYVRVLAARFSEQLGQPAVVDNRTGGSFVPPVQAVSTADPDGHTLLLYSPVMQIAKAIQPSLPFDPVADVAHVAKIYEGSGTLMLVRADSPFKSMQDVIAGAKAAPGALRYGGQFNGTGHLNAAIFLAIAGAQAFHIPYKAPGDDLPALLRGEIDFSFVGTTTAMGQVSAGKFRVLGVTTARRMSFLPDVPTTNEVLKNEVLIQENWSGLAAPAKTPPEIMARLHAETLKALGHAALRKVIEAGGNVPILSAPQDQYAAFVRREFDKYREVVKIVGLKSN
jgi:tripartite-type tricarboxylate transporter receptor subunit TctC